MIWRSYPYSINPIAAIAKAEIYFTVAVRMRRRYEYIFFMIWANMYSYSPVCSFRAPLGVSMNTPSSKHFHLSGCLPAILEEINLDLSPFFLSLNCYSTIGWIREIKNAAFMFANFTLPSFFSLDTLRGALGRTFVFLSTCLEKNANYNCLTLINCNLVVLTEKVFFN